ncbi:hypothetical protein PGTUg99_024772 [Puccinia graminis f. sp. tritici]|uniref:Yeast cell wall synthesis Kre9/Knh1-like N-terminal domain-containing protein n=1 Tax=Puccinia graminis f. sp. tritici TaxID=56615 RepID=A0A5B0RUE9_PUCGR|nr:hypothetical protein PGTUg99_024772 [Puccinia graminis f. sp. tritici]
MQFYTALLGLVALSSGVTALSITSPSGSSYWVQFSTNTIAWSLSSGDPTSVSIQIINPTSKQFNGPFSIAEYVPAAKKSYDVTNVQLTIADGYEVTAPAQVTYAPGTHESSNSSNNSTSNANTSSKNSTMNADINGNSFKNSGNANTNAKSSSVRAAAMPSMVALALGSLCALVA